MEEKPYEQMSLLDTYKGVEERLNNKPELFQLLDEHLDWEEIIPARFYGVFYQRLGRRRDYSLESFLKALFLQRIFHYVEDSLLPNTLRFSYEMRDYCGFKKVPDASKLTRFKQDFFEAFMPEYATSNSAVKHQYINGHFCYAQKATVVANGLGIVRHLELFDDGFKAVYPEMQIEKRTKSPDIDKEIGDSTSLKPVLLDFKAAHPAFHYCVF